MSLDLLKKLTNTNESSGKRIMGDKGIHEDHFLSLSLSHTRLLLFFLTSQFIFYTYIFFSFFSRLCTSFQGQFYIFVILSLTHSLSSLCCVLYLCMSVCSCCCMIKFYSSYFLTLVVHQEKRTALSIDLEFLLHFLKIRKNIEC